MYVKISNIFLQKWNICMKMNVSMHYEPISPARIMSILHQGVITPFLGQLWAGCRKSNKYHRNPHKITFHLILNMLRYAILHTKIRISNLGTSLYDWSMPRIFTSILCPYMFPETKVCTWTSLILIWLLHSCLLMFVLILLYILVKDLGWQSRFLL